MQSRDGNEDLLREHEMNNGFKGNRLETLYPSCIAWGCSKMYKTKELYRCNQG